MITPVVGQRIVSRRKGCRPQRGTVESIDRQEEGSGAFWVRVQWDHGPSCLVRSDESRLSDLKRG